MYQPSQFSAVLGDIASIVTACLTAMAIWYAWKQYLHYRLEELTRRKLTCLVELHRAAVAADELLRRIRLKLFGWHYDGSAAHVAALSKAKSVLAKEAGEIQRSLLQCSSDYELLAGPAAFEEDVGEVVWYFSVVDVQIDALLINMTEPSGVDGFTPQQWVVSSTSCDDPVSLLISSRIAGLKAKCQAEVREIEGRK